MGLFSGSGAKDPNGRNLADLIAGSVSDDAIRRILRTIAAPKIGELRFTSNLSQPVQGNIYSASDLPAGFNGWLYANGTFISKTMFPEAARLFESISYAGKQDTGTSITVPVVSRLFRLNAGGKAAYFEEGQEYAMPSHVHSLGDPTATTVTQTIKRCAFIWSTDVNTSAEGGKMPAVKESAFSYGKVTYQGGIPEAPSAHRGGVKVGKYRSWDVPIDTTYMQGKIDFSCQTGNTGTLIPSCQPAHKTVPLMVYVGMAN